MDTSKETLQEFLQRAQRLHFAREAVKILLRKKFHLTKIQIKVIASEVD